MSQLSQLSLADPFLSRAATLLDQIFRPPLDFGILFVTYRTWRLYMSASARAFEAGNLDVNQTLLAKVDKGKSSVPLLRADLYA